MYKFIVQDNELDGVVTKLEKLLNRLRGQKNAKGAFVEPKEFKLPEATEEYVDEAEISPPATVHHIQQAGRGMRANAPVQEVVVTQPMNQEVDSKNMPWDSRIHASSRAKVADGTWRYKRGVDEATINQVESMYRGSVQQPSPAQNQVYQQPSTQQPAPAVNHAPPAQQQIYSQPVAQSAPPMPQPQMGNGHTLQTFTQNFALIIGQLITEKKLNAEYVGQLAAHFGVDQIWKVNDQQKEIIFNDFVAYGTITKVG